MHRFKKLQTEAKLGIEGPFHELKKPAFHFFDLPRELRDLIYSLVFAEPDSDKTVYDLAKFRLPPIMRISKQAREEAGRIHFAECRWSITVPTKAVQTLDPSKSYAELLDFNEQTWRRLPAAGDVACFRDVLYSVADISRPFRLGPLIEGQWRKGKSRASLHIKTHPSMEFLTTYGNQFLDIALGTRKQVKEALAAGQAVAETLRAREGFKGYTVNDLKAIEKAITGAHHSAD